jgi:hypothetical protein
LIDAWDATHSLTLQENAQHLSKPPSESATNVENKDTGESCATNPLSQNPQQKQPAYTVKDTIREVSKLALPEQIISDS